MPLDQGEMAERSNALVLKTKDVQASGGSNPSFSAKEKPLAGWLTVFFWNESLNLAFVNEREKKRLRSNHGFIFILSEVAPLAFNAGPSTKLGLMVTISQRFCKFLISHARFSAMVLEKE